jgi:hypothetical protein
MFFLFNNFIELMALKYFSKELLLKEFQDNQYQQIAFKVYYQHKNFKKRNLFI